MSSMKLIKNLFYTLLFLYLSVVIGCLSSSNTSRPDKTNNEVGSVTTVDIDNIAELMENIPEAQTGDIKVLKFKLASTILFTISDEDSHLLEQFKDTDGEYYFKFLVLKDNQQLKPTLTDLAGLPNTDLSTQLEKAKLYDGLILTLDAKKPIDKNGNELKFLASMLLVDDQKTEEQTNFKVFGSAQWYDNQLLNFFGDWFSIQKQFKLSSSDFKEFPIKQRHNYQVSITESFIQTYKNKGHEALYIILGSYLNMRLNMSYFFDIDLYLTNIYYANDAVTSRYEDARSIEIEKKIQTIESILGEIEKLNTSLSDSSLTPSETGFFQEKLKLQQAELVVAKEQLIATYLFAVSDQFNGRAGDSATSFHIQYTDSQFFKDIQGYNSAIALSWINPVCNHKFKYIYAMPYFDSLAVGQYQVDIHEVSHMFGAYHEEGRNEYQDPIMEANLKQGSIDYGYLNQSNIDAIYGRRSLTSNDGFCQVKKSAKSLQNDENPPQLSKCKH